MQLPSFRSPCLAEVMWVIESFNPAEFEYEEGKEEDEGALHVPLAWG